MKNKVLALTLLVLFALTSASCSGAPKQSGVPGTDAGLTEKTSASPLTQAAPETSAADPADNPKTETSDTPRFTGDYTAFWSGDYAASGAPETELDLSLRVFNDPKAPRTCEYESIAGRYTDSWSRGSYGAEQYDMYTYTKGLLEKSFAIDPESGRCFYFFKTSYENNGGDKKSYAQLKEIASELMKEYAADLSSYKFSALTAEIPVFPGEVKIQAVKYLDGVRTADEGYVTLNEYGEIRSFDFRSFGTVNTEKLPETFDSRAIKEQALKKARDYYAEKLKDRESAEFSLKSDPILINVKDRGICAFVTVVAEISDPDPAKISYTATKDVVLILENKV